jgi:hypothetical protein
VRRPSAATLIALAALFVALGGPATAARLIDGSELKPGSVGSKQLKDRSVAQRDLARSTVRKLRATPNSSITAAKLGASSVTTRALAPGSVLTGTVGDDSLTASDLAASSVTNDEVADNAVGQPEIRNNGVGSSEIADNSIDGGEIVDGGLLARDVGRFWGELSADFTQLPAGQCQAQTVAGTAADVANADISGDMIVIAPLLADPLPITLGVARSAAPDRFRIYACNTSGSPYDPPAITIRYVIIGF